MKKFLAFISIALAAKALGGVSIGGGSGSSRALTDLASVAFDLDHLPQILVNSETLRRAEARLSVEGMEAVEMPMEGSSVTVRKLNSSVVDTDVTKRFVAED